VSINSTFKTRTYNPPKQRRLIAAELMSTIESSSRGAPGDSGGARRNRRSGGAEPVKR
jgi:hypothetical protein